MSERTRKLICMFLVITSIVSSVFFFTPQASATETPKINVEPSSIIDTSLEPGKSFIVNVTVANVTDLFGWQIKLYFSPTVLECKNVTVPIDNVFTGLNYNSPAASIDNTGGTILKLALLVGTQPGVNTSKGMFCRIGFGVKARGKSDLTLGNLGQFTYMLNSTGAKIAFEAFDGFFDNRLPISPAKVYIDPERVVDPTLTPCHNFTMNISIAGATGLYKWNASLFFKNDILNMTDAVEGSFLTAGGTTSFQAQIQNDYNATHGKLTVGGTLVGAVSGVDGNGTLASITFHVIGLGNTTVEFAQVNLYDEAQVALPYYTVGGYFDNVLVPKLYVIPPEIIDPSLLPPARFNVTVAVDDIENLYGYEFNLTYDNQILACYGIIFNSPLGEEYFTSDFEVNDASGFIWVKVDFYPPANPIQTYTNETLVTIFFRVKGMGSTFLNLTDTHITDPDGQPIYHEAHDGFFCTLIRDVAVTGMVASTSQTYIGWLVYINVTVLNKGNVTETFNVKAYYGNDSLIGTLPVNNLAPESETTITFTWNTTGASPCHNYTLWAEAVPVPYEFNTGDNVFIDGYVKILLLGDVNHDGIVELMDFQIFSIAFGSYPGHPRWNPECDLNQDGVIELMDFLILSRNFGQSCPP
jgi:hypothetical protein